MKQILLSATFAFLWSLGASAQCTPDPQFIQPGVYPDSATGMSIGTVGVPYDELITIVVPYDTTIMVGPFPFTMVFDSIVVTDWQGLPSSLSYACYDAGNTTSPLDQCAFEGNTNGCIAITGTPVLADVGSHQQIITTQTYTTPDSPLGEPTETIVDYYYIQIVPGTTGIYGLTTSKFLLYPNPANEMITLNGLNNIDVESIEVYDANGRVHASFDNVTAPALDLPIGNLDQGMYYVQINYNGTMETLKFVKD